MADKIYPSAKPPPNPPPPQPSFPPKPPHRPPYRPPPPAKLRRPRRACCRPLCCWLLLTLLSLALLLALAGGAFYALFRPQRPQFSVSSLRLQSPNSSNLELAVTARNPNKKIAFLYGPIAVSVAADGAAVGRASLPAFVHGRKNTTVLRVTVGGLGSSVGGVEIELETKAGVRVGGLRTRKVGIRVRCEGMKVEGLKGKEKKMGEERSTVEVGCKVRLRVKIWKWTV